MKSGSSIRVLIAVLLCLFAFPMQVSALQTIDLDSDLTAETLVNSLLGKGVEVSNITFTGANVAAGSFDEGQDAGIGLNAGVILSSGKVGDVIGPNDYADTSNENEQPGDTDLDVLINASTNDAAVLEFDFVPVGSSISFRYVMGSDEYPEYLDYSDVFGFFLDGENIALLPGTTTPVSITNINHHTNSEYYISNSDDNPEHNIQCDGFTVVLEVLANVTPGQSHHIKLAVADKSDYAFDTWVFIEGGSFISGTDVAVSVTAPTDPQLNASASYSIVVNNFGPHKAEDVEAIIRLPDTVSFGNASVTQGTWAENNGILTCNIGTMEKEEIVTVTLNVQVKSLPLDTCIAQVSSSSFDLDFTNNNDPEYHSPIAKNDSYSADQGTSLNINSQTGVLSNDESVSVYDKTAELVNYVSHGSLTLNSDGSFKYTSETDYVGEDSFTYKVFDKKTYSDVATVTIMVNEAPVRIAFSLSNYTVHVSQSVVEIIASLSKISSNTITVDYATSDGTATAGSDYAAANGTLTFNPGEISKTFAVTILDNGVDEHDEMFNITLSNPANAALGTLVNSQVKITRQQSLAPVITQPDSGTSLADSVITVRGTTDTGATVEIFVNGVSQGTTLASSSGRFSLSGVQISQGENAVTAVATNAYGVLSEVSDAVTVSLDPRPEPPGGLATAPGDTVATITWNANSESDIQGYHIYRDGQRLNHELLTETTFTDSCLTNGRAYSYTVTAVDSNESESLQTDSVTGTPVAGTAWE